jgi:thiazole synthase ThiGH ThiG subunit
MLRRSLVIHLQVVLGATKYRNYNVCVDLTIKSTMLLVTLGRRNETLVELDNDDMSVFCSQMSAKTLYHFEGCYEAKLARIS